MFYIIMPSKMEVASQVRNTVTLYQTKQKTFYTLPRTFIFGLGQLRQLTVETVETNRKV